MEDSLTRIDNLKKTLQKFRDEKTRSEVQLEEKKKELQRLEEEITQAGFDPEKLEELKEEKEKELAQGLKELETDVEGAKEILKKYAQY